MSTDAHALACLRAAGRIASAARERGARRIVAGARLRDVCEDVEEEIRRRGGGLAFPTQSSRNKIAAHYCPSPEDDTVYEDGDLAKLDIGVHVDGWVVDTATHGERGRSARGPAAGGRPRAPPSRRRSSPAGAGVPIRRISEAIESTLRGARGAADAEPLRPRRGPLAWCTARRPSRTSPTEPHGPAARGGGGRHRALRHRRPRRGGGEGPGRGLPARPAAGARERRPRGARGHARLPRAALRAPPARGPSRGPRWRRRCSRLLAAGRLTAYAPLVEGERTAGGAGRAHDLRGCGGGGGADAVTR